MSISATERGNKKEARSDLISDEMVNGCACEIFFMTNFKDKTFILAKERKKHRILLEFQYGKEINYIQMYAYYRHT